jgi:GR25 family glycosyltransferase involved in LPS biosynthesis
MNEPIHVIEHDTWIFDPLPYFEEDGEDIFLFAFYEESFGSRHKGLTDTVAPCAGYYITPKAARDLVEWVHKNPVDLNVDWAVHDVFEDYHTDTQRNIVLFQKYITPSVVCRQIKHGEVGTTIEHNVSH